MIKKFTFYAALLFCAASTSSIAQTTVIERGPSDPHHNVPGVKSTDGTGAYGADAFVLTEETAIGQLDFYGKNWSLLNLGSLEIGFNVYIYADDNGVPAGDPTQPGTGIVELSDINPFYYSHIEYPQHSNFTNIRMTDANGGQQIILPPGTYWITGFVTISSPPDGNGMWVWDACGNPYPPLELSPLVNDPYNIFGGNWTQWTTLTVVYGEVVPSLTWTMRSEEILSIQENQLSETKIYPNPAKDIVHINLPADTQVYKSGLFDMTGKMINNIHLIDNTLNISSLPEGIYLLKIETSKGVLTRKIVRK